MHSLRLDVDNSVYTQFLSYVKKFKANEVNIVEDTLKNDFSVYSVDEIRSRVLKAEQNSNYAEHDEFWNDIDKKLDNI